MSHSSSDHSLPEISEETPAEGDIPRMTPRQWGVIAVATVAVMLLAIDGTVLSLAVPHLTRDLNPSSDEILWIGDIYSFALAGLLVTMGNLADRIGRKKLLLIGSVGFAAASALAAFAPSATVLILARALLGVFGATIMPSTLSIIRDAFRHPLQRTRAIAIWSVGASGGAALGPIVGGFLLEHFHWGSVFLINLPIMLAVIGLGIPILRESRGENVTVDWLSAIGSVVAIIPLVWAVKHVAHVGFDVAAAISLLIGLVVGIWFIRRQMHLDHPLLDLSLFRIPAFAGAVVSTGMAIFALVGLLFFFSQYLQLVRGLSPLQAGMVELPATVGSIVATMLATRFLMWMGRGRAIGAGLILLGLGIGVLGLVAQVQALWPLLLSVTVVGFGVGLASTLATDAVVSAAPVERAGAASAISETSYEMGVAMGIAVLGSVQTAAYRAFLPDLSALPAETAHSIRESLARGLAALEGGVGENGMIADAIRIAFTQGMQVAGILAVILMFASGILAWRVIPSTREVSSGAGH
ncbi:MAG: MFS transporter [Actinomycetaceae bacterium]|nr:MFS transporter [Actinomycetaceae bacterium]